MAKKGILDPISAAVKKMGWLGLAGNAGAVAAAGAAGYAVGTGINFLSGKINEWITGENISLSDRLGDFMYEKLNNEININVHTDAQGRTTTTVDGMNTNVTRSPTGGTSLADESISHASIDGIDLQIETIEDGFEKAIAVNEMPYRDGALTDDLGLKARRIKFRCYFWEDSYEAHKSLLNHLRSRELFELIHPKYGLVKGRVESVSVRHDDRVRTARLDISFVEHLRSQFEGIPQRTDVLGAAQDAYEAGISTMKDEFLSAAVVELGAEGRGICSQVLTSGQTALSQLNNISRTAQRWVKSVDTFVAGVESAIAEVANPANTFIAAIDFGLTLPGRVIGSIAHVAERYSLLYDSLRTMPEKFLENLRDGMYALGNAVGYDDYIHHGTAQQAALSLAEIYARDEDERDLARALEQSSGFDSLGNYVKASATPELLNVRQVEQSLTIANAIIQDAIDRFRSMQALKALAGILTAHATSIKIESEKLVTIYVDNETPLHLLCMQRGLPYNYAERIWTVNSLSNPNTVKGTVQVYVR